MIAEWWPYGQATDEGAMVGERASPGPCGPRLQPVAHGRCNPRRVTCATDLQGVYMPADEVEVSPLVFAMGIEGAEAGRGLHLPPHGQASLRGFMGLDGPY